MWQYNTNMFVLLNQTIANAIRQFIFIFAKVGFSELIHTNKSRPIWNGLCASGL